MFPRGTPVNATSLPFIPHPLGRFPTGLSKLATASVPLRRFSQHGKLFYITCGRTMVTAGRPIYDFFLFFFVRVPFRQKDRIKRVIFAINSSFILLVVSGKVGLHAECDCNRRSCQRTNRNLRPGSRNGLKTKPKNGFVFRKRN